MEYRAFLLSSEDAFVSVTGSKRAVTVTLVMAEQADTERIFIPIADASADAVAEAVREMNPDSTLPVYRFGLPKTLSEIGEPVNTAEIVRNFVKIL